MKKGELLELEITKYAFEGKGIAKVSRTDKTGSASSFVVFVNGAYPGDKVIAKITRLKKSYAEAKPAEILSPSHLRVEPLCRYFGICGGCKQQDLKYEDQLRFKQQQVEELFWQLGRFREFQIENIIHADEKYFYRNKMDFSFAGQRWLTDEEISTGTGIDKYFALGLHVPNMFDKVVDIEECFLQSEQSNKILNFTRNFFKQRGTSIYSTNSHTGLLRNLVIKQSHHTKDLMVNLVTSSEDEKLVKEYSESLLKSIPQITTVINNINRKKALVAEGDYEFVILGPGYIADKIGGYTFRISANSFFQTNTMQAEKLFNTALSLASLRGDEIVYDLYSGTGAISIFISKSAAKIFGFEAAAAAVTDARENAKLNSVVNTEFYTADLYKTFLPVVENNDLPLPQVVFLDPPRSGMHKNTVMDVVRLKPEKIVYVSCNPATQIRDIKLFSEEGYHLVKTQPVDMFPHTYHIENVALLVKEEF